MTVADVVPTGGEAGFERTPPQDLAAEQCVLGGMLLSKDAIADVVEVLRPTDFYRPAHQTVYDAILDLYGRGEPADPVTVAAQLTRDGSLAKVGGAPYLHTLIATVPTAANAGYYARIVRERAILRRLVEAGTKIVQIGYGAASGMGGDVDEVVDRAQAAVYDVTERRTSEDYVRLDTVLPITLDEIESIGSRGGQLFGVPTGFRDLDELTNGLHPGQMVIVAARPAVGKALALDTPLPTPTGWTTMGEVRVGDLLLGSDGRPTRVVATTEVLADRPCYEVTFSDGTTVVADAQHQWLTDTRASRRARQHAVAGQARVEPAVRTTEEIAATLRCEQTADRRLNHSVRNTRPLDLPEADLPVPPYTLGAWLGDGNSRDARLTSDDPEIVMHIGAEGLVVQAQPDRRFRIGLADHHGSIQGRLRALGVLGNKHVPAAYLRASESQRRALLAGLLDTDGTVTNSGGAQFSVTSRRLAEDVRELIHSLGYRCSFTRKPVRGRSADSSTAYTITFRTADTVFRLSRKRLLHKERMAQRRCTTDKRFITAARPVPSVPVRCVEVDNADHLYLATRAMVPTHNSTLGLDLARSAAIRHDLATCIFSLEMSRSEITMRLLSAEARVPLHHMRTGQMSDEDWNRLARRMGEVADAPLFIDDSPNLTMMEIRAKARRLRQRHDLKLVIVDYLQLMNSTKRVESRQQEVSEMSRALKLLAKELEVPVVAISQLNRGPEQRTDKKPQLSDLRESGCLTAETRVMRADTGAEVSLGELLASGARDIPVWSLDDRLKLVPRTMTHVFPSGVKEVYRLRFTSGREITATANHPFLTYDGWTALGDLVPGSRVGSLRHVPPPLDVVDGDDDEIVLLAQRIGDFVPASVFALPKRQVGLFLRHLWATDGSISWDRKQNQARIYYASTSRRLVDDIARLLLRFNVFTRVATVRKSGYRDCYHLHVTGTENQLRFCDDIGVHGARGLAAAEVAANLRAIRPNTNVDTVPREVWDQVKDVLRENGMTHREFAAAMGSQFCGSTLWKHAPSRTRLARVAQVLDASDLEVLATNDVFWDEVASIESLGLRDVYDATVLGTHNFVADGVPVHNSLEQDADMVILLYREDVFERESPRAGEADLIVAKHRNGPTSTVTVAFQGHYSRFVDMQQN